MQTPAEKSQADKAPENPDSDSDCQPLYLKRNSKPHQSLLPAVEVEISMPAQSKSPLQSSNTHISFFEILDI